MVREIKANKKTVEPNVDNGKRVLKHLRERAAIRLKESGKGHMGQVGQKARTRRNRELEHRRLENYRGRQEQEPPHNVNTVEIPIEMMLVFLLILCGSCR